MWSSFWVDNLWPSSHQLHHSREIEILTVAGSHNSSALGRACLSLVSGCTPVIYRLFWVGVHDLDVDVVHPMNALVEPVFGMQHVVCVYVYTVEWVCYTPDWSSSRESYGRVINSQHARFTEVDLCTLCVSVCLSACLLPLKWRHCLFQWQSKL